jgi:hypothetical protein
MMTSTGVVTPNTVIMTLVHDSQVLDLPDDLFKPHDMTVDLIVTPTRVISCVGVDPVPRRPTGLIWSLLTTEQLEKFLVLKRLRYREWKNGRDVHLSGEVDGLAVELNDEVSME